MFNYVVCLLNVTLRYVTRVYISFVFCPSIYFQGLRKSAVLRQDSQLLAGVELGTSRMCFKRDEPV